MELEPKENKEFSTREIILQGKNLLKHIYSKRNTVLVCIVLGAILGLTYSFLKKPIYTAALSFALEDKDSGGGLSNSLNFDSPFGLDLSDGGGGAFSTSNLPELFLSRNMIEKTLLKPVVVDKEIISLADMYIQNKGWRKKWENKGNLKLIQFPPNSDRSNFTRAQDSVLGEIYKGLIEEDVTVFKKDKKVSITTVNVLSTNELFAKDFTEGLVQEVSDFYIDYKSKKAKKNLDILLQQRDSVRRELSSAITGLALFVDKTFNLNPALNVKKTPAARKQVDVQTNTAVLAELVKQTELAKVNLRKETPLIQIIDRPIFPLEKDKISKIIGLVLGGLIGAIICLFYLIMRIFYKQIMEVTY